ncbi:hypothetical protein EDD17DRAFT_1140073 [Pisolithus thermaeus]|nr:hypothetical protein EV401DRAFT_793054 [Pisolithus croceorrhizus]KAI6151482.1 hypothetical protein EDD17DRAFT_1140073 [Pisolithus thermaeus]
MAWPHSPGPCQQIWLFHAFVQSRVRSFIIQKKSDTRKHLYLWQYSVLDSQNPTPCTLPSFDHEKADVILRSSDNINPRIFKLFLSLASIFFETLFDLPQPSVQISTDVEIKDGLPVITASEDSNTLDPLLRFCYPCSPADDSVLDENLKRCRKRTRGGKKKTYSLDTIERMVCKSLSNREILETSSLRCFALACGMSMFLLPGALFGSLWFLCGLRRLNLSIPPNSSRC